MFWIALNSTSCMNAAFVQVYFISDPGQVGTDKKKLKERYVILCDGLLIVCSQTATRRPSTSMAAPASLGELRYRDKYAIRLINIGDREDEEGIKYSFELCPRDQQKV